MTESALLYAERAHLESRLVDTSGFRSRPEDIHLIWQVIWCAYSWYLIKKTGNFVSRLVA